MELEHHKIWNLGNFRDSYSRLHRVSFLLKLLYDMAHICNKNNHFCSKTAFYSLWVINNDFMRTNVNFYFDNKRSLKYNWTQILSQVNFLKLIWHDFIYTVNKVGTVCNPGAATDLRDWHLMSSFNPLSLIITGLLEKFVISQGYS